MKELDLHKCSFYDVKDVVENFVLMNDTPFRIVTGKSEKMKNLAETVLKKHRVKFDILKENLGETIVTK